MDSAKVGAHANQWTCAPMRPCWSWGWENRSLVLRFGATVRAALTPNGPHRWFAYVNGSSYRFDLFDEALWLVLDALRLPAALSATLEADVKELALQPVVSRDEGGRI